MIREVADALNPDGVVSIHRLRAALLSVQGAQLRGSTDSITPEESDRLMMLYNDVQRQHGGVLERVTRIERALRDFEVLDTNLTPSAAMAPEAAGGTGTRAGSLRVIGIDKTADDLDNDRLVDLLFQLLLRQVRTGGFDADVLVILGADRIRRSSLESLVTFAQQSSLRVLLFFEHLRDDAIQLVGGGGAAAAFFALGNHKEAREASDFIGAGYKWVESQHTRSEGESLTQTHGQEWSRGTSRTRGFPTGTSIGVTQTEGGSYSQAFGQTKEYSVGEQRVREAVVEPEELQGLPVTEMIYVEVVQGGNRVKKVVDCHPQICFAPRVSPQPFVLAGLG